MKNIKAKIKQLKLDQIIKYKNENKAFKQKILQDVIEKQQLYDQINLMQDDIRQLLLKLSKEERELWLKEKGKKYERHIVKKKSIKKQLKSAKNNKV